MAKRIIKTVLNIIAAVLVSLVVIITATITSLLIKPDLVVNLTTLEALAKMAPRFGVAVSWQKAVLNATSIKLSHKAINWRFTNLCVLLTATESRFCFDKFAAAFEVAYQDGEFKLPRVGPVLISSQDILVNVPSTEEARAAPGQSGLSVPKLVFLEPILGARFEDIRVDLARIRFVMDEKTYEGRLSVLGLPSADERLRDLSLSGSIGEFSSGLHVNADSNLRSPSAFAEDKWQIQTATDVSFADKRSLRAEALISRLEESVFSYDVNASVAKGRLKGQIHAEGSHRDKTLKAGLNAHFENLRAEIPKLDVRHCGLRHEETDAQNNAGHTHLYCPVDVSLLPPLKARAKLKRAANLPSSVRLIVRADADGFYLPDTGKKMGGTLSVEMIPVTGGIVQTDGYLKTWFAGVPNAFPKDRQVFSRLDALFTIPEFQNLVRSLENTWYAVPAPLNVFAGQAELGIKGEGNPLEERKIYPLQFESKLASPEQKMIIESAGDLAIKIGKNVPVPELTATVKLTDVQLALPHVKIAALPQLLPDERIKPKPPSFASDKKIRKFKYEIRVATPADKPARLLSQYAKKNIPIHLDLVLIPGKILGTIGMKDFDIAVFTRSAHIDHLSLDFKDPREKSIVSGKIDVRHSGYDIDVLLLGTLKRPRVLLQSTPDLPREDIISLLVFGRTFDDLSTTDSESVGGLNAAIADRALSLATLFALSSTPIKNLSYDPATRVFAASLELGGGTTVTLGSNWKDQNQVGLKKSLGKNWIISTEVTNPTDPSKKGRQGAAFLEWSHRY